MTIHQKIQVGDYTPVVGPLPGETDVATKERIRQEAFALREKFWQDVFQEYKVLPGPFAELMKKLAWDRGHSAGYSCVLGEFQDLLPLWELYRKVQALREGAEPASPKEIQAARDTYQTTDITIDDDAQLSIADDGFWVSAWVWLTNEEVDSGEEE